MQYVGETLRAFEDRLKEHLADIRLGNDKPVANHYNGRSHTTKMPRIYILEHVEGDPHKFTKRRKRREMSWIHELRSFVPYGLNKMGK